MTKTPVGFIGLGIMGAHMAGHILGAGHPLHVHNRTRSKADSLVARGAVWHDQPGEVAGAADVVITIIGTPADVERVYLGPAGLIDRAKPGSVLVDATTSSPSLAERIATAAAARGVMALDAPVSGGEVGARDARLAIMIGGDAAAVAQVRPVLELMGSNVVHMGGPGAGQHTKMANQIAIASTMVGVSESLSYAGRAGLDLGAVLKVIGKGAAQSFLLNNLGPRMVQEDYKAGFYVHHFIKDLGIALAEAERMRLDLPGLALAKRLYEQLAQQGHAEDGTQALYRVYQARAKN